MSEPSAQTPASVPMPARSDFAETEALIHQIAAEARSSGKSLIYDPEAIEALEGEPSDPAAAKKAGKAKAAREAEPDTNDESETDEVQESTATDEEASPDEQDGDEEPAPQGSGEIDVQAVKAALSAEGGVDVLALAKALGKELEEIGLTPGQAKFVRLERKKADQTLKRANDLALQLRRDFGLQVDARKAVEKGELDPAIKYIEATFGRDWNEINKMVAQLLKGQPVKDVAEKSRLRELEAEKAQREAADKKAELERKTAEQVTNAKTWIKNQIKGDPLASIDVQKQLEAAGFPTVADLVFQEMQAGYKNGLTDPRKALDVVRQKLVKQAKALRNVGLTPKSKAEPHKPMSASKPRANAQTGAAGNARQMTDAELREAVLKEAGLWRS